MRHIFIDEDKMKRQVSQNLKLKLIFIHKHDKRFVKNLLRLNCSFEDT